MLNEKAKTEEMNSLIERADTIVETAEIEKRELTETELTELNEIKGKVTIISETIKTMNEINKTRSTETMEVIKSEQAVEETRSVEEIEYRTFDNFLRGVVNERNGEMTLGNNVLLFLKQSQSKLLQRYTTFPLFWQRLQDLTLRVIWIFPYIPQVVQVYQ